MNTKRKTKLEAIGDFANPDEYCARMRYKDERWGLQKPIGDPKGVHWTHAQLAILMDIREELKQLRAMFNENKNGKAQKK